MNKIKGTEMSKYLEKTGCSIMNKSDNHTVFWSVSSGRYFIAPNGDEVLNKAVLRHILWNVGISNKSFAKDWESGSGQ